MQMTIIVIPKGRPHSIYIRDAEGRKLDQYGVDMELDNELLELEPGEFARRIGMPAFAVLKNKMQEVLAAK
jgi:hypothetical protein